MTETFHNRSESLLAHWPLFTAWAGIAALMAAGGATAVEAHGGEMEFLGSEIEMIEGMPIALTAVAAALFIATWAGFKCATPHR